VTAMAGSAGQAMGDVDIQMAYLRAVIRVYGPWTTSKTISSRNATWRCGESATPVTCWLIWKPNCRVRSRGGGRYGMPVNARTR